MSSDAAPKSSPVAHASAFHENRAIVGLVAAAFTIGWSTLALTTGRLVHRIGAERDRNRCSYSRASPFHGRIRTRPRLGVVAALISGARHGVSFAGADRGGAKQRPGRAHGQCDHQPTIRAGRR
jgi:hypothetical protein